VFIANDMHSGNAGKELGMTDGGARGRLYEIRKKVKRIGLGV
jgi:hypothetical protein